MKKLLRIAAPLTALALLAGCATQQPQQHMYTRTVEGAFVAEDQHLYLFSLDKTLRFAAAPFRDYRALVASPLQQAVACTLMFLREDFRPGADANLVRGSYGMLLHASQVTAAQARQFGLVRLEVSAKEAAAAALAARGFSARPPRNRYEQALDPACQLPATGGSYYSALFESEGQWVQLPDRAALFAQSRFPQPIQARGELIRPARESTGLGIAGTALGIAALPVTLPVLVLSIPFLGPEHWK